MDDIPWSKRSLAVLIEEGMLDELTEGLNPENIRLTADEKTQLVRAALGLTLQEAENAFCRAIVQTRGLDKSAISVIYEEKNQVVRKTGVLEFVKSDLRIDDIGGLENLKNWLIKRNNTWQEKAKMYNLPAPKGVLITGVPGCGKSLTAKAMSTIWGLPLLKLDMGKIFGGIVGSSEENMRKAIATAEAVAPSILWVDEIEKGFAGTQSDGDSGTSARVFGTFLTWMQDKTAPVFVIATSNDISRLPPELLRKGRFDEIFFVDLPTTREREKIFQVHLKKRTAGSQIPHQVTAEAAVCAELAAAAEGFSGAEIEQAVIAALYDAFYADRGLTQADVLRSIRDTVPLAVTQREQLTALRSWAEKRAVLATAREDREERLPEPGDGGYAGRQGGRLVDIDL
jgi:SpoVK/Ycf46/Vps4 family AAA+-type ATPase